MTAIRVHSKGALAPSVVTPEAGSTGGRAAPARTVAPGIRRPGGADDRHDAMGPAPEWPGAGPPGTYMGYPDKAGTRWVQPAVPPGIKNSDIVAVLGDSISDQGHPFYSSNPRNNWTWASQLAQIMPGKTLWVAARGGLPATGGDANGLLTPLLARHPGTLVLELGINDFHAQKPAGEFKAAMMKLITRIRSESPATRIVLMGVRDTYPLHSKSENPVAYAKDKERIAEYKAAFDALGQEVRRRGGVYIPDMFAGLKDESGLLRADVRVKVSSKGGKTTQPDPIHPNEKGGYAMARHVERALLKPRHRAPR